MQNGNFISAVIVSYNDCEKVCNACRSILENTKKYPLKLYVIDNASSDDTAKKISEMKNVEFLPLGKNIGFGAAHNRILDLPMGKYHFVINPDITVDSDVLGDMADFMEENPDIVMAMPKILNADGTEQKLPKEKPNFKRLFFGRLSGKFKKLKHIRDEYVWADREINTVTDIDFCSGCFFCMRSDVFCRLGGFDERFFMYLEDADITQRAKKFGRTVINPQVCVTHLWERESAKSIKYLFIHLSSYIKYTLKKGG